MGDQLVEQWTGKRCWHCGGAGEITEERKIGTREVFISCALCGGGGILQTDAWGSICPECHGNCGTTIEEPIIETYTEKCPTCNGTGRDSAKW